LPSVPRMSALILKAEQAYASSDWTTAIILYDRVSQETNWLANVISAAANPYYNATADELVVFFRSYRRIACSMRNCGK
jgi:hypothetical protein